jgi:hypothetical protein
LVGVDTELEELNVRCREAKVELYSDPEVEVDRFEFVDMELGGLGRAGPEIGAKGPETDRPGAPDMTLGGRTAFEPDTARREFGTSGFNEAVDGRLGLADRLKYPPFLVFGGGGAMEELLEVEERLERPETGGSGLLTLGERDLRPLILSSAMSFNSFHA